MVLLVLPVIVGGAVWWVLRAHGAVAAAAAGLIGASVLGAEGYLMAVSLGRSFERVEPMQVG